MILDDHPQQLVEKQESKSPINILNLFLLVISFTDSIPWDVSPLFTTIWENRFFPNSEHANPRIGPFQHIFGHFPHPGNRGNRGHQDHFSLLFSVSGKDSI